MIFKRRVSFKQENLSIRYASKVEVLILFIFSHCIQFAIYLYDSKLFSFVNFYQQKSKRRERRATVISLHINDANDQFSPADEDETALRMVLLSSEHLTLSLLVLQVLQRMLSEAQLLN